MASTPPALPAFDNTEGCLFLAAIFTSVLGGVAMVQSYLFLDNPRASDKLWLRIYVFAGCILDTTHSIMLLKAVYIYLVKDIGNPAALLVKLNTLVDTTFPAALLILQVQLLYAFRIWNLSRKKWLLACILVPIAGHFVSTTVAFIQAHVTDATITAVPSTGLQVAVGIGAVADTSLALIFLAYRHRRRLELKQMNSLIDRVALTNSTGLMTEAWNCVIGSGLITGPWSLLCLITSLIWKDNLIFILLLELLPKLYFNCMLTSLNMRRSARESEADPDDLSASKLAASSGAADAPRLMRAGTPIVQIMVDKRSDNHPDGETIALPRFKG